MNYLVATIHPWNREAFAQHSATLPGNWRLVTMPEELTPELIVTWKPRYVFFPHWSWKVPAAIFEAAECVCFHMTDVPYGRGGSPLQNLIIRGHAETRLSALRMVAEMDAGPVYLKRPLGLEGAAHEIYARAAALTWEMIREIVLAEPAPVPQQGEPTCFPRRRPADSLLPQEGDAAKLYDHIRMLDAPGYPAAFVEHGDWRLEFTGATPDKLGVTANVRFVRKDACVSYQHSELPPCSN